MNQYTVVVKRPYEGDPSLDTYWAHINAESVAEAQEQARAEAWEADTPPPERDNYDEDERYDEQRAYRIVMVIAGHHYDISVVE